MILLVFVMMLYDMFVHRKEIAEFLRAFPKFSALRYGRHAQDAGRYGRFTPARRSALDRFAVAALKIAYVLAVMASIFGLAVHFFSVKLGSKDILNIVFSALNLLATVIIGVINVTWMISRDVFRDKPRAKNYSKK